jgi:hypothetical protein
LEKNNLLNSSARLNAVTEFGQGLASTSLDSALNRRLPLIQAGQGAANSLSNINTGTGTNLANLSTGTARSIADIQSGVGQNQAKLAIAQNELLANKDLANALQTTGLLNIISPSGGKAQPGQTSSEAAGGKTLTQLLGIDDFSLNDIPDAIQKIPGFIEGLGNDLQNVFSGNFDLSKIGDVTLGDVEGALSRFFSQGVPDAVGEVFSDPAKASKVAKVLGAPQSAQDAIEIAQKAKQIEQVYGSAFWDSIGGDFSGFGNIGTGAAGAFLGAKGTEMFLKSGAKNSVGAAGAVIGGTAGSLIPVLGPVTGAAGAVILGTAGNFVGSILGDIGILNNSKPDYDILTSSSSDPNIFESRDFVETPLGKIGFNAQSTRDLTSKAGKKMLQGMQESLFQLDTQIASSLTPEQLDKVKSAIDGSNIGNAHRLKGDDIARTFTSQRLSAIKKALTPSELESQGFSNFITQFNDSIPIIEKASLDNMKSLFDRIDTINRSFTDGVNPNDPADKRKLDQVALMQDELDSLLDQYSIDRSEIERLDQMSFNNEEIGASSSKSLSRLVPRLNQSRQKLQV